MTHTLEALLFFGGNAGFAKTGEKRGIREKLKKKKMREQGEDRSWC